MRGTFSHLAETHNESIVLHRAATDADDIGALRRHYHRFFGHDVTGNWTFIKRS